jgi:hypothetical protein
MFSPVSEDLYFYFDMIFIQNILFKLPVENPLQPTKGKVLR